jgi:hypothetical protein
LTGLCDIASKDIQSKLDENNILEELFSPFAAKSVILQLSTAHWTDVTPTYSHKRIREMEHELFQSKLKPVVDGALVSDIIRSSSSGLNSHRAVAIELILESSIEERRERMSTKAKDSLRRDSTPRPKSEAPNIPVPQVQSQTPANASQPPSRSLPNDTTGIFINHASASAIHEAAQDSSAPSEPAKKIKEVARREEPLANDETNPSPSEDLVELICRGCNVKLTRSCLLAGLYCIKCPYSLRRSEMKCVGCGATRVDKVDACADCHRKFK